MLRTFLHALHGENDGYRCGVIISGGRTVQQFFPSDDALAAWLSDASAAGHNVYHACALFAAQSRKADAAIGASAFWLDLDVGDGKPFASQVEAVKVTCAFAASVGIPVPTFISSGRGVHVYWFLDDLVDRATWQRHASGLKAALHRFNVQADPTRTADIASILRPPETKNPKNGATVAVMSYQPDFYQLDAFAPLLQYVATVKPSRVARLGPLCAAAANIYSGGQADANRVADQCRQMSIMRETRGLVSEPVWHAAMGVLAFCDDGEDLAHEWSAGDERYSESETQKKYDRAALATGPTTCAHFQSINPQTCGGCPFAGQIATPVQLGRDRRPFANDSLGEVPPQVVNVSEGTEPILMPHAYELNERGLVLHVSNKKTGAAEQLALCRMQFWLDGIARGELRDDRHFYVFKQNLPHEGQKIIELAAKDVLGQQGIAMLAGKGVVIERADEFRQYVRDAVHVQQMTRKLGMMYEQCGWKENDSAFLLGTRLYRQNGMLNVQGTAEVTQRGKFLTQKPGGSLEGWKRASEQIFGIGREAQSFALLASFAAPLIRFLSTDEGGAIVSLVSRGSGRGKSTALAGATSVWGDIRGLQLTNADTAVSRGLTFGVLGNLPVVFDELAARDPDVVRNFVEMFTNGRDKMRGTQEGEIKHTLATWQTILIAASNVSLVDSILSEGGSPALTFRILELPVELPLGVHRKGDEIKEQLHSNWGYAGDHYMRYLVNPATKLYVRRHVQETAQALIAQHGFRAEHRFWVRTLACCMTAGLLANHLGLVQFATQQVIDWALEHCKVRAAADSDEGRASQAESTDDSVEVLAAFINEHVNEILVLADAPGPHKPATVPRRTPVHRLTIRYDVLPKRMYIPERDLRRYLTEREFGFAGFIATLMHENIIVAKRRITLGAGSDFVAAPTVCYEFDMGHPRVSGVAREIAPAVATRRTGRS